VLRQRLHTNDSKTALGPSSEPEWTILIEISKNNFFNLAYFPKNLTIRRLFIHDKYNRVRSVVDVTGVEISQINFAHDCVHGTSGTVYVERGTIS
jgi:hypothetical protein